MNHYGSYWKFYDEPREPLAVNTFYIRRGNKVATACQGDLLWLFTSGDKVIKKLSQEIREGQVAGEYKLTQAYLVEVFLIQGVYEVGKKYPGLLIIKGYPDKCKPVLPPLWIDDIARPRGWGKGMPIGQLRQGGWKIPGDLADALEARLRKHYPDLYSEIIASAG